MIVDSLSNKIGYSKGRAELASIPSNTSYRTEPMVGVGGQEHGPIESR